MNKFQYIYSKVVILIYLSFCCTVLAEVKTQVNDVTDFFEKSLQEAGGAENLKTQINDFKQNAMDAIMEESPKVLGLVTNKTKNQLEAETQVLKDISPEDLHNKGMGQMIKEDLTKDLHTDYIDIIQSRVVKDAQNIINVHEGRQQNIVAIYDPSKSQANRVDGLAELLGIDCEKQLGSKILEPKVKVKKQATIKKLKKYNKTICEALRNKYRCSKSLQMRCEDLGVEACDVKLIDVPSYTIQKNVDMNLIDFAPINYQGFWTQSITHDSGLFSSHYHNIEYFQSITKVINLKFDTSLSANIADLNLDIAFDGFCEIKLNNKSIFLGPNGGVNLTRVGASKEFSHTIEGSFFSAGRSYYKSFDIISNGKQNFILKPGSYRGNAFIHLLNHQKSGGVFNLEIKVIGSGVVKMKLLASKKACKKWSEFWEEKCLLQ